MSELVIDDRLGEGTPLRGKGALSCFSHEKDNFQKSGKRGGGEDLRENRRTFSQGDGTSGALAG